MRANLITSLILGSTVTLSGCTYIKNKFDLFTQKIPEIVIAEVFPPVFPITTPSAKANHKYRLVSVGETIQLDGGMSVNRQAGSLSYQWRSQNLPANSQAQFTTPNNSATDFSIDKAGRYDLQLQVTDNNGASDYFDLTFSTEASDLPSTSFIAIGDAGTGGPLQFQVAEGIKRLCEEVGCDFVVGTGDNFYPTGVEKISDKQFESKFEEPYKNVPLPFYMTLGNHDTNSFIRAGDGIYNPLGDIQLAYARDRNKPSFRFQMPARYYNISTPVESPDKQPLVDIYALDTTLLTSPKDVINRYKLHRMYQREGDWLKYKKSISKAQWQITLGHHTYISNGKHGNAGSYDNADEYKFTGALDNEVMKRITGDYVKQFTEEHICEDSDLYIAGHDHNLQYLKPHTNCGKTEFIVTGAGARTKQLKDANRNPAYWQADDLPGFFHINIVANQITIAAYTMTDGSGTAVERFSRTLRK